MVILHVDAHGAATLVGTLCEQAGARGMAARRDARQRRRNRAATVIQAAVRMHRQRRAFVRARQAAVTVQSSWRGRQGRKYAKAIA